VLISGHTWDPGESALSRRKKNWSAPASGSVDFGRRDFLFRCCQGASTALIPAGLRGFGWPSFNFEGAHATENCGEFHLHPQYRVPRPLDGLLLKARSDSDDFLTERYADQIGKILSVWSSRLLVLPQDVKEIDEVLLSYFRGLRSIRLNL